MNSLETKRLILRKWELDDCDDLFEYAKTDLVGPNAGWQPHKNINESLDIIKIFMKEEVFAIVLKSENKVIGSIGLHQHYPDQSLKKLRQREIGYVLNPKYWGNEYIPEAVNRIKEYCFEEMKLDLVWCGHFDSNNNSRRVNEKCGFNYQFQKEEIRKSLNNKKVVTLYYNIYNKER